MSLTPEREKEIRCADCNCGSKFQLLYELDRVRRLLGDAQENAALAIMGNNQLQAKLEVAVTDIRLMQGMCGNPDAAEGCRLVMKYGHKAIANIKGSGLGASKS